MALSDTKIKARKATSAPYKVIADATERAGQTILQRQLTDLGVQRLDRC